MRYTTEKKLCNFDSVPPVKVPGRRIYEIQPNGHKHWNREEILNKTSGGDLKKMTFFMHKALTTDWFKTGSYKTVN